ncbi:MAG TPA: aromatic ring-hydroxylating dioxygenase subunit alpha [Ktedonobacteraceae bacterium]
MDTHPPTQTSANPHIRQLVASRQEGYALPRAFYHDLALYAHESQSIWRNGWLFAGFTCQIPHPGDFFTLNVEDDTLIILRGDDEQIRAFHNVCTHRGTLLTTEAHGSVRALVCPYHQWTFTRQGELFHCSGMQEGLDKSRLGLHQVQLETCAGLIFLSFAHQPPAFEPARQSLAPLAMPQGFERAKIAWSKRYEVKANWKLIWENNRECYHCNVNHPQYIKSNFDIYEDGQLSQRLQERLAVALERSKNEDDELAISHRQGGLATFPDAEHNIWYAANRTLLTEGYLSESLDGQRVAPLMGTYHDERGGVLRLRTLPNFWCHASCDHAVTTHLLPLDLHRTLVRVTWLVHEEAQVARDYTLEKLLPFWQLTSEQDWGLCERVQRGVNSSAYLPGPLSILREYNLDAFLRWYLFQLSSWK